MDINIGLIGPVSTGKSTFLNAFFSEKYSDMMIKRTTMLPQIYQEMDDHEKTDDLWKSEKILEKTRRLNESLYAKMEQGNKLVESDIKEIIHKVPKIYDLLELTKNVKCSVFDIPGLNDSATKQIYIEYLKKNFHKFDIIILMIDIKSAFNTSDELEILEIVLQGILDNKKKYDINTHLMVLINKCDDMFMSDGKLVLEEELHGMYEQAKKIIGDKINQMTQEDEDEDDEEDSEEDSEDSEEDSEESEEDTENAGTKTEDPVLELIKALPNDEIDKKTESIKISKQELNEFDAAVPNTINEGKTEIDDTNVKKGISTVTNKRSVINWNILPISSEYSYIYRVYQKNPYFVLDAKHQSKFGLNEFGKNIWNSFADFDKKLQIHEFFKTDKYIRRLECAGFYNFKNILQTILNQQGQHTFLLNHIKHEICMFDINKEIDLISDDLEILHDFKQRIRTLNLFFNDIDQKVLCESYTSLNHTVEFFIARCHETISSGISRNSLNIDTHDIYIEISSFYKRLSKYFPELYDTKYLQPHKKVIGMINEYYLRNLMCEINLDDKLKYLDKLIDNSYEKWQEFLIECIKSDDLIVECAGIQINTLEIIKNKYKLSNSDHINLVLNLLDTIYWHELKYVKTEPAINKKYATVTIFWNTLMVKTTNTYCDMIHHIKNMLNYSFEYKMSKKEYKNYDNELEKYLYTYLKTEYPKDFVTHDDVIDGYHSLF